MKERRAGQFQVSLMNAFRQAALERDSKSLGVAEQEDGDRKLSLRSIARREGADQDTLRNHLASDLSNLLATIHLEATLDLSGFDHVRRSILNYGIQDMSRLTAENAKTNQVVASLREQLLMHEPRLIPETLSIKLRKSEADSQQRIAFDVSAEMTARPVDVPLEFVAEIDTGAGKIAVSNLAVRG